MEETVSGHNLKGLVRLFCFCLVFALFTLFANVHLVTTDLLSGITIQEMQSRSDIDIAFVGSSVTVYHFDPAVITRELGLNSFNCAIHSASLPGETVMTKELFKTNSPKYVVLVVEPYNFDTAKESIEAQYRMLPFLSGIPGRLEYVLKCASLDGLYLERLLPIRGMFPASPGSILKTLRTQKDASAALARYAHLLDPHEQYEGSGFLRHEPDRTLFEREMRAKMYKDEFIGDYYPLLDDSIAMLDEYRQLVSEHGATLLVAICPNLTAHALAEPDFLPYTQSLMAYCREHEVPCFNFQYAKPELMPCLDEYFFDIYHMCGDGADILTRSFARVFSLWQQGQNYQDLFYQNSWLYQDSLQVITNTWVWPEEEKSGYLAGANVDFHSTPEFRFALIGKDGTETPIRGYSTEPHLDYDLPEGCQLRVYARRLEDPSGKEVYYDYPADFWFARRVVFQNQPPAGEKGNAQ